MSYSFSLNENQTLLKEGLIIAGSFTDLENIHDQSSVFEHFTSYGLLSWYKQGSLTVEAEREYAQLDALTPMVRIRHDLIRKDWTWQADVVQFYPDILEVGMGLEVEEGDTLTVAYIGPTERPQEKMSYVLVTERSDYTPMFLTWWHGQAVGENVGPSLEGNEHSSFEMRVVSFLHPEFRPEFNEDGSGSSSAPDFTSWDTKMRRGYGAIIFGQTPAPTPPPGSGSSGGSGSGSGS